MNTKVVYYTKSGNTEKIAKAIATELNVEASDVNCNLTEQVDLLFLGASVYKFGIDKKVLDFIDKLDANRVKKVVIFSTSAMSDSGYPKLKKRLTDKGINVSDKHFYCRGEFMMFNKNLPSVEDVNEAKKFARSIIKG